MGKHNNRLRSNEIGSSCLMIIRYPSLHTTPPPSATRHIFNDAQNGIVTRFGVLRSLPSI
ncbi:hypothetical protein BLOT_012842 [Blomia tropicalis]|nr:hypothetical protein BLOT_012842 [Blomia tropicalis]